MKDQLVKLKALKDRILKLKNESSSKHYTKTSLAPLVNQIHEIIETLKLEKPELFNDYQLQIIDSELSGPIYKKSVFDILANDISYYIDIIEGFLKPDISEVTVTDRGIFFAGQYFDAIVKIAGIVEKAKKEIILIDGYLDEKIIQLFASKNPHVELKILTKQSTNSKLQTFVNSFNMQYGNGKLNVKISEDFHDRFLILDRKEFYHFGASFKDAGNKGFMFSLIEEPLLQGKLLNEFDNKWK